ncbi:YdcH family protein [Flexibacterium corallicola]|uniref:YdcH family protein n=1 Tax=Flexibacterium corallicola TaxID=3037259 RepID=UPI00286F0510|nr:DUF465 domain-containing protein [Pseudovibrio sp. M1P-2-3]
MSIQARLSELERRHASLEKEIEGTALHPSVDSLEIAELKRRKLLLKEQISQIKIQQPH